MIAAIATERYSILVDNKLMAFNILFNNQNKDNSIYILSKHNYQSISIVRTVFNLVFNIPIDI